MSTQIDILINNAGRSQRSLFLETNVDVYQALMELNYLGTVSVTKQVLPHMTQRGTGSIVTVSSVVGIAGAPLATGYSATKHALQVKEDYYHLWHIQLNRNIHGYVFIFFMMYCVFYKVFPLAFSCCWEYLLQFIFR